MCHSSYHNLFYCRHIDTYSRKSTVVNNNNNKGGVPWGSPVLCMLAHCNGLIDLTKATHAWTNGARQSLMNKGPLPKFVVRCAFWSLQHCLYYHAVPVRCCVTTVNRCLGHFPHRHFPHMLYFQQSLWVWAPPSFIDRMDWASSPSCDLSKFSHWDGRLSRLYLWKTSRCCYAERERERESLSQDCKSNKE